MAQESELYGKICSLIPWQIMNIQIAHLPKAKRVRPGLEDCHRASILLLNDNTITIETEYLKTAQEKRERFVTPVRVAIFALQAMHQVTLENLENDQKPHGNSCRLKTHRNLPRCLRTRLWCNSHMARLGLSDHH